MKTNSSKNRKADTPTSSSTNKVEGVHKNTVENPNKEKSSTKEITVKTDDKILKNFLTNQMSELKDYLGSNKSLITSIINKELRLNNKSHEKIMSEFKETLNKLNVSTTQYNALIKAKEDKLYEDSKNYENDLLKKFGLMEDTEKTSKFLNDNVSKMGDFFRNNLNITKQLIEKEMHAFGESKEKEYNQSVKAIQSLGLSKEETKAMIQSLQTSILKDKDEHYQALLKKYNMTKTDKDIDMDKKESPIVTKLEELKTSLTNNFEKTLDRNSKALKGAWLGSLNLITAPLEDFFGFDTMDIFKKALHIGDKKSKKKPTISDVQKRGDDGALLLNNTIEELFGKGKKKKDEKGGLLEKITDKLSWFKSLPSLIGSFIKAVPVLGTALRGFSLLGKSFSKNALGKGGSIKKFLASGATKASLKAISPMAIITSIIMMVVDGIKGIFKAKEWGVPKGSAFLGGLFGGVEKGAKGVFKNMGKWALMGFGVGCLFTPIGGIVGGIIGGIFGAVLGAIGGERLARFFTEFGEIAIKPFKEIKDIWNDKEKGFISKISETLGKVFGGIFALPFKFYRLAFEKIKNWFSNKSKKETSKEEKKLDKQFSIGDIMSKITNAMSYLINPIKWYTLLKDKVFTPMLNGFFSAFGIDYNELINKFASYIDEHLLNPLKNLWTSISDWSVKIFNKIVNKIRIVVHDIFSMPFKIYTNMYNKIKNWFTSKKEMKKQEKQMKKNIKPKKSNPIGDFFNGVWENIGKAFKDFLNNPITFVFDNAIMGIDKIMGWVWDGVSGLIQKIFGVETVSWKDFKTQISDTIQKYVLDPMFKVFGMVGDFFDMLFHDPKLIGKAIIDKNFTMGDAFEEYFTKKEAKVESVNDAIIKKDGSIIRTSEDDNLIATKNNPTKITSMTEFNMDRLKDIANSGKNNVQIDYTNKFDKMIGLLEKLLDKEIVVNNDNSQSLSDLRVLAGGYNVGY